MAVLEVGIQLDKKPLVEIKYYSTSDNVLEPRMRAQFLTGVGDFLGEAFGDEINVISLSDLKLIVYLKKIHESKEENTETKTLLSFAIIEQDTDPNFVKKHLKKIISVFRKQYPLSDILSKKTPHFHKFKPQINEILGDLRFKIDDRLRSLFRD
ncbi:MAG: hypothetical protein ACW98D_04000 [Promethearchaeota archaeon]|jgi:hypothetical protein